jgi:glycosyltransferase involved in cell wall biosynthesis
MELVLQRSDDFDILHFHTDFIHFPLLRRLSVPAVTTLHGALNDTDHAPLFAEYGDVELVAISAAQRRSMPRARFAATIHHGMPPELHRFASAGGDYLAFIGRVSPQKGLDRAIRIALRAERPLKIAARIYSEERAYYSEVIQPLLRQAGSLVEFIGEVGGEAKEAFLQQARAVLFPIDWCEPFGLVMIEALASGTPVIAWNNGSVPEVIDHGKTGFIVSSIEEGAQAVDRVDHIERAACRAAFDERFDVTRMARRYVELYRRLAERSSAPRIISLPRKRAAVR